MKNPKTTFFYNAKFIFFVLWVSIACQSAVQAQSHKEHIKEMSKQNPEMKFENIVKLALGDSGLVNKNIEFNELTLDPGFSDTISHRHPCETFVYVIEGDIEYREGKKPVEVFKTGSVLYERPNSLHTLLKNPNKSKPTRVLLVYLYTKGKPTYVREYPPDAN
jgi:quercetin dioxygenase-like cupin family protein